MTEDPGSDGDETPVGTRPFISLLTDYGTADEFVAVCKGVMWRIVPAATLLDVTHEIRAGDVRAGALALARAIGYLPSGVHFAVVDPGVGTDRRALALRAEDGRFFVGPDNGLLSPAVALCGGAVAAVELEPARWNMPDPSPTFAGRDVFAVAAAALAGGVPLEDLGTPVAPELLRPLLLPLPQRADDGVVHGVVFWVDRFGNCATNITEDDLAEAGIARGDSVVLRIGERRERVPFVTTFADVPADRPLAFIDSAGQFAVAVNGGDAARELDVADGTVVAVEKARANLL